MTLKRLPLHELHESHGATFGEFAGYQVPEAYRQSTVHEHLHTRKSAGLFDVSHKKQIEISGAQAPSLISRLCPVNGEEFAIGAVKYTFLLNEQAGIIDHLLLIRRSERTFLLIVNGPRARRNLRHIAEKACGTGVELNTPENALLALQGPQADSVLQDLGYDTSDLPFMHSMETQDGYLISRSGYTGENGLEISVAADQGFDFVERLLKDARVAFSGQSARNSLRLEAGLCRYDYELTEDITPVEAGLIKSIPRRTLQTGMFIGAPALKRQLAQGARRLRMGLTPKLDTPISQDTRLVDQSGNDVGYISSTGRGPSVRSNIAMGYVDTNILEFGLPIYADEDGRKIPLSKKRLPFLPSTSNKKKARRA